MTNKDIFDIMIFSEKPSEFFEYLRKNNLLRDFPELYNLIITPQEPDWHPEGSVWVHTMMVIDVAAEFRHLYPNEIHAAEFMFGALCHDFGKPYTTIYKKDKFKSPTHDSLGIPPTISFLNKLGLWAITPKVQTYVLEHLKPTHLYKVKDSVSNSAILRIADRINLQDLVNLCRCDHWGRTDEEATNRVFPAGDWLLERYSQLNKAKRR